MKKPKRIPQASPVSVRVRFASHEQLNLIKAAAARRGISRDLYIQRVLQASSMKVLELPPDPVLDRVAELVATEL